MAGGAAGDDDGMISEINVTPLVDITLVLLIVFMVTAKIIVSSALPLDLPKAAKGDAVQLVFSLEMHKDGKIFLQDKDNGRIEIPDDTVLLSKAKTSLGNNPQIRAVIRADGEVPHKRIIRVLDLLKQSGINKIAFGVAPIAPERGAAAAPAPAASN